MDDTTRPGTNEHDRDERRERAARRTRLRRAALGIAATGLSITGTTLGITGHEELALAAHGAAASLRMLNTTLDYRTRR